MSAQTLTRSKGKGNRAAAAPAVRALPQVNLLPQHVRDARRLRAARRLLGLGLIGVLGIGALGYGATVLQRMDADAQLVEAQAAADDLTTKEAQYAEVPAVRAESQAVIAARTSATTSEVLWQPVLASFAGTLPAGTAVTSLTVSAEAASDAAPTDPLSTTGGVGSLQFTARSDTVPDVAAWMDGLSTVPGFLDVWISGATKSEDENAGSHYEVGGTLQLSSDLLALRFDTTKDE